MVTSSKRVLPEKAGKIRYQGDQAMEDMVSHGRTGSYDGEADVEKPEAGKRDERDRGERTEESGQPWRGRCIDHGDGKMRNRKVNILETTAGSTELEGKIHTSRRHPISPRIRS